MSFEHKVTVRHPDNKGYEAQWVAVCTCNWFTSYFAAEEYSRARAAGDQHEKLYSLPDEKRRAVQQHAFTMIKGTDVAGKTVEAHGQCGCGWKGPDHKGETSSEKANADCSAHYAAEIAKAI